MCYCVIELLVIFIDIYYIMSNSNNYIELKYLAAVMMYADAKSKDKKWVLDMVRSEFQLQDEQMEIINNIYDCLLHIARDCGTSNYLDLIKDIICYLK